MKPMCQKSLHFEEEIRVTEQEDAELTSFHKHIKNISTLGAIITENKLVTGRKLFYNQDSKERSTRSQVGKKEK